MTGEDGWMDYITLMWCGIGWMDDTNSIGDMSPTHHPIPHYAPLMCSSVCLCFILPHHHFAAAKQLLLFSII
jgi:hypothetical protein